ncbi:MAG: heavy metal translocating P-type ATPase [Synechococcaceae cyanobacterium]
MPRPSLPLAAPPPQQAGPILLEVAGLKCGGCVRAVEQRLRQHPAVRDASVNLLTRTAWVELNPAAAGVAADPVAELRASLAALGFEARRRDEEADALPRLERRRQRHWWTHWRQLIYALALLLVSGLGHLAEAGELPWGDPWNLLGRPGFHAIVATVALLGPGRPILRHGLLSALGGLPSMDTLVGLGVASAYISSLLGWLLPRSGFPCFFNEPVMLLGFVLTGRFLEERARWRTGRALESLVALQPDQALLLSGDGPPRPVRVGGLRPGDRLRILPGDRLPVDGVVVRGESNLDLSSLTGESLPQSAGPGAELPAGALNLDGALDLEVRRSGAESAIARIVRLVQQAQDRKAPIQALADRVAGRFTLVVLLLALGTFLFWWLEGAGRWPQLLAPPTAIEVHGHHAVGLPCHGLAMATPETPLALALQLAIAVLVVACPCALGLATPAAIAVGLGQAARSGLLFRGGEAIETADRLRTVLFDKTGTLTLGRPLVRRIEPLAAVEAAAVPPALPGIATTTTALAAEATTTTATGAAAAARTPPRLALGESAPQGAGATAALPLAPPGSLAPPSSLANPARADASAADPIAALLRQAAALEQQSRHPLAHALLQEAQLRGLTLPEVEWARSTTGAGVEGQLRDDGPLIRVGRLDWLDALGVVGAAADATAAQLQAELAAHGATVLAVAAADRLLGVISVQDPPRPDAAATVAALRQRGLRLGLLSGDREEAVRALAAQVGLEAAELAWQLRPEQKQERILAARAQGPVAMVGDGINDAPAIAAADLGIAVGTGTQIAQESADLVVLGERLEGLVIALDLAHRTMAKVRQNLAWAFGYNLIALPIAAGALLPGFGWRLSPPLAALLMACSSITVVLNALLLHHGGTRAGTKR